MKYIINENRLIETLDNIIEKLYGNLVFTKTKYSFDGTIPGSDETLLIYNSTTRVKDDDENEYKLVVTNSLWVCDEQFSYISSLIPLSEDVILNRIGIWFINRTDNKKPIDEVLIHLCE